MTKAVIFYHDMRQLTNNKEVHTMVNDSNYPIPQVQDKKKGYTAPNIKRVDCARRFQHITDQPIKRILHAVNNNILQNLSILWEDAITAEDIYEPSIPHLKGKTVRRNIQHVEPVKIKSVPKTILDTYKGVTIYYDLMHINKIDLINTISQHIM